MKRLKQIFTQAGWLWAMIRRPYLILCVLFAAQQALVLLLLAGSAANVGLIYPQLYYMGGQWFVFGFAYLAAGVISALPLFWANGKTKAGYTLLALPQPRWQLLAAQALLCLALQLGVLALGILLMAVTYFPVAAISARVALATVDLPGTTLGLYRSFIYNELARTLLPTRPRAALALVAGLAAAAAAIPCALVHKGTAKRIVAVLFSLATIGCAAGMVMLERLDFLAQYEKNWVPAAFAGLVAATTVLLLIDWLWATRALRRAELV